jgi:FKBP-type peptidyl-prolyl cis-trans isomerase FkpA
LQRRSFYIPSLLVLFMTPRSLLIPALLSLAAFNASASTEIETLASGVTIAHSVVGSGAMPTATDRVKVHYRGTLVDGTEFDSSYARNEPAVFPLNRVVLCWTQALQRMKVGGKAKLTCPSATAYGERGAGRMVPPNSTLNFDVELLAIER